MNKPFSKSGIRPEKLREKNEKYGSNWNPNPTYLIPATRPAGIILEVCI